MLMLKRFISLGVFIFLLYSCSIEGYGNLSVDTQTKPIVLVTGFEPFGQFDVNPSQLIAQAMNEKECNGALLVGLVLPVDFNKSVEITTQAIAVLHPVLIISIGLEGQSHVIHVEKLGVNLKRDPSANGSDTRFHRINPNGPFLRVSHLPVRTIVRDLKKAGIPSQESWSAGTYVCNALFYGILGYIDEQKQDVQVGFIHVPLLSSQDPLGMDLDTMLKATEVIIRTSLEHKTN